MNNTCTFMKNLRVLNNLTQEELSQRIGITASAYSHFETGIRQPDINTLVKLCCFYKINIMHLIYLVCMDMCPTEDQAPGMFQIFTYGSLCSSDENTLITKFRRLDPDDKQNALLFITAAEITENENH
jgi:transcriptional regulator with XRE-family HTH domain